MSRKKLLDDIVRNPIRIYRGPADVLRDRRFGDAERLEILRAWQGLVSDPAELDEIGTMIVHLEGRICTASGHAAE